MNKVELEGWVEQNPNIRYFGYTHVRADFNLRTEEMLTEGDEEQGGQEHKLCLYHRITAWGDLARFVEEHIRKGQYLRLVGRLNYDKSQWLEGELYNTCLVDCKHIYIVRDVVEEQSNTPLEPIVEIDWASFAPGADEDPMA